MSCADRSRVAVPLTFPRTTTHQRALDLTAQVPGINSLLTMINSRRRKETFILSSVTGLCTLILLWYIWG